MKRTFKPAETKTLILNIYDTDFNRMSYIYYKIYQKPNRCIILQKIYIFRTYI